MAAMRRFTCCWAPAPRPAKTSSPSQSEEEAVIKAQIKKRMEASPGWFTKVRDQIKGVSEETTTGVHRLYELQREGPPALPRDQRE
jgi:hypothetical protein